MRKLTTVLGLILFSILFIAIACGGDREGQPGMAVSRGGPVTGYVSLVDSLRAAGAAVDPAGTISQPFFVPEGQLLNVNGEGV